MASTSATAFVVLLVLLVLLAGPRSARALPAEGILEVHADATVRDDGEVAVDETVLVLAQGKLIQHGISVDLPLPPRVDLEVSGVTRDGQPETWRAEEIAGARRLHLGDARAPLSHGTHVYVIAYRARRLVSFLGDRDELRWEAIGGARELPIAQAAAVVHLPAPAARELARQEGFVGGAPALGRGLTVARRDLAVVFTVTRKLAPDEGLGVLLAWPKGYLKAPPLATRAADFASDHRLTLLALLALVLQALCLRVGRGSARVTAAPGAAPTEPPRGLSPAALRYLLRARTDRTALAATLLALAHKGSLAIARGGDGVHVISPLAPPAAGEPLTAEERAVREALFGSGGAPLRIERAGAPVLAAAGRALQQALASDTGARYFFGRAHFFAPGLALSLLVLATVVLSAAGLRARAQTAALVVSVPVWVGVMIMLVGDGYRTWRRARARATGAEPAARAPMVWLPVGLLHAAGLAASLVAMSLLTSALAAPLVIVTIALDYQLWRLPPAPNAEGRTVRAQLCAYREHLSVAPDALEDGARLPYAVALGVNLPPGNAGGDLAAALTAATS